MPNQFPSPRICSVVYRQLISVCNIHDFLSLYNKSCKNLYIFEEELDIQKIEQLQTTLSDKNFTNLLFSWWNHIFFNVVFLNSWLTKYLRYMKKCSQTSKPYRTDKKYLDNTAHYRNKECSLYKNKEPSLTIVNQI